jgi:hypothetical protein
MPICVGRFVLFAMAQVFPQYPPAPYADPSIRHQVQVSVPARLSVQRTSSRLSVSYDLASLRKVKITVGEKMALGIKDELRVYVNGDTRPQQARAVSEGSLPDPAILKATESLTTVQDGIPAPRKRYIIEHDISLFETDIPPQHLWNPENSRKYRVLWEEKLKTVR